MKSLPPVLPVALPWLGEEEAAAAAEVLASGWVTQGPKVLAFEQAFARLTGAPHACAVSSCTTALHLALLAAGVQPGDVVLTVSHTFIATANAIRACGAEPVFVDIDPETLNLCPEALRTTLARDFAARDGALYYADAGRFNGPETLLGRLKPPIGRLAAVLVVHQVGMPADLERILPQAQALGIPVLEDAACALGSQIRLPGRDFEPIGKPHGVSASFSFHPRKVLTTGDGGMLTTADPKQDRLLRLLRQHGMSIPDAQRHNASTVVFEEYLLTGHNYRLTDIQAGIGLVQLGRLEAMLAQRRELAAEYTRLLAGLPGVRTQRQGPDMRSNWQSYVVTLPAAAPLRPVMEALLREGISTRRGIMCCHLEPPYAPYWPQGCLPASEAARDHGLILPLHHKMTAADCARVVESLGQALAQAKEAAS